MLQLLFTITYAQGPWWVSTRDMLDEKRDSWVSFSMSRTDSRYRSVSSGESPRSDEISHSWSQAAGAKIAISCHESWSCSRTGLQRQSQSQIRTGESL
jgi:hypothetical protein